MLTNRPVSSRLPIVIGIVISAACACGPTTTASATPTTPTTSVPALWREADEPRGASAGLQWIAVDTFDGKTLTAAVSRPVSGGSWPVLVVLHGDGGLRFDSLNFASAFTRDGFLTVTPCWQGYTEADANQQGVPVGIGCAVDAPSRDSAGAVMRDLTAIAEAARTLPGANQRVALIGHSAGGTAAALTASLGGAVDAVVAISGAYGCGQILTRWGTCLPQQVDGLRTPLLIVHGTNDTKGTGTRIETVRAYVSAARDKGKNPETLYVEGAPHELPHSSYWTDDVRAKVVAFLRQSLSR